MSAPLPRVRGVRNRLAYEQGLLLDEDIVPGSVARRRARITDPHVAELNRWAQQVAIDERRRVPWFDPASGGVHSRVLVLLQDPSSVAAYGSRFISRHNNDQTAHNTHLTATRVGLAYEQAVNWNVVPWWVGDPEIPAGEREGLARAARRARSHMHTLLEMLSDVRVVVLLGRHAQRAWDASGIAIPRSEVLRAPHPSPLAFNAVDAATGRRNSELLTETFALAVDRLG